jgi:glutamate dehydrogenase (NAD(P)+)
VPSHEEVTLADDASGFRAYLVVQPTDQPISFGGTRIDLCVTHEMVRDLAANMALKLAGHGSPVGGAKAGLRASPSDPRLPEYLRCFAEKCRDFLSSTTILGKDMGAKQWMLDEIYSSLGMPQLGIVQKRRNPKCPDRLSQLDGYIPNMTGKGAFWAVERALGGAVSGARILIQGFGVVGWGVAWHLSQSGARIVGISDRTKAVFNPRGLQISDLAEARSDDGLVNPDRLPGCAVLEEPDDLLAQDADVLILAAGSYLIDARLASRIMAELVVEAANMTLLPEARHSLHRDAIRVVPDVVASSSSAAMVAHQIASGNVIPPRDLWDRIERSIKDNTDAVLRFSRELDIDSKTAFQRVIASTVQNRTAVGGHVS